MDTCDAKLVSNDDKEFNVHKAVAAIASDVLRVHFFHDHPGSSYHKIDCKSEALIQIVDFMYKGWQKLSASSFNKFCRLHPGTRSDALNDWVNTMIEMILAAKKLKMSHLVRSILLSHYDFLKLENVNATAIVVATHDKSATNRDLCDLTQLCYHFYWRVLKNNKNDCSVSGDDDFESRNPPTGKGDNDKALLFLGASDDSINGLYLFAEEKIERDVQLTTYHHKDGTHIFKAKRNSDPPSGIGYLYSVNGNSKASSGVGFFHSGKPTNGTPNESSKAMSNGDSEKPLVQINVCNWSFETDQPVWTDDNLHSPPGNPIVLRI